MWLPTVQPLLPRLPCCNQVMASRVVDVEDCGHPDFRWITLKRIHVSRRSLLGTSAATLLGGTASALLGMHLAAVSHTLPCRVRPQQGHPL